MCFYCPMRTIREILYELVSIQSDTGTALECAMADRIFALIREIPYFAEHPERCGLYDQGDFLHRPVVWALREGRSPRTLVLNGHYDAVEIETYSNLKGLALSPDRLREALLDGPLDDEELRSDLEGGSWCFGRGTADMKAGLAINLHLLAASADLDASLLFTAVPDEENVSAGMLQAIDLLGDLRRRFSLEYRLAIVTEPRIDGVLSRDAIHIIHGSMGKVLPVVLAKGVLTHSAELMNGLNSTLIVSEIAREMELRTDLLSEDEGVFTQPPTILLLRDLKNTYDVSVPEYSVACVNALFLRSGEPAAIVQKLVDVSRIALERSIAAYGRAFDVMAARGFVKETGRRRFEGEVILMKDLESRVRESSRDYDAFKAELDAHLLEEVRSGAITLQTASILYMKAFLEKAAIANPAVVIGVAPPYYPAVNTKYVAKDVEYCLSGLSDYMGKRHCVEVVHVPYFGGMADTSYLSCPSPEADRAFLDNLTLPKAIYDVPVEKIAALDIPTLMIGPAGKYIHQAGERVYLPDVESRIPDLLAEILRRL